jgi:hypothetical protein
MIKPIFVSLTFGFLLYGTIGIFLGLGGGFPYPCDHNVKATVVSCTISENIGEFIYSINYIDFQQYLRVGSFTSQVSCPLQTVTQYVDICYGSYAPDDFKMNQPIVFPDYKTPIVLFTTGIISIMFFILFLVISCKMDPPRDPRLIKLSELSSKA